MKKKLNIISQTKILMDLWNAIERNLPNSLIVSDKNWPKGKIGFINLKKFKFNVKKVTKD